MIKSSLIKTGIITVLAMLILCGCGGRTGKEPDAAEPTISGETNKPTASVEANRDALQSIDPVYTQSPENVNGTVVPNESPENNNMDNSNQTSNTAIMMEPAVRPKQIFKLYWTRILPKKMR